MKFLAALALFFSLASAAPPPVPDTPRIRIGLDGYIFQGGSQYRPANIVRVFYHPSIEAMRLDYLIRNEAELPPNTLAYAVWSNENPVCEIHIVDQRIAYTPEIFGHELTHCVHGSFHPNQGSAAR